MEWTAKKPEVPGWYWWRAATPGGFDINPRIIHVVEQGGVLQERETDGYIHALPEDFDGEPEPGEWAGPLEPPEEAR